MGHAGDKSSVMDPSLSISDNASTKLFADKENNCDGHIYSGPIHQNGKGPLSRSSAAIPTLKHAHTADEMMIDTTQPNSQALQQPADNNEHQMEGIETDDIANRPTHFAVDKENNNADATEERCNLGENTLQSTDAHINHSNMIENIPDLSDYLN